MDGFSFSFFLGFMLGGIIIGMVVYFNTKREFERGNELMCDTPDLKMLNEAERAAIRAEQRAKFRRCRDRKCREYVVPEKYTKLIMKDPVPISPKEEPKEE